MSHITATKNKKEETILGIRWYGHRGTTKGDAGVVNVSRDKSRKRKKNKNRKTYEKGKKHKKKKTRIKKRE